MLASWRYDFRGEELNENNEILTKHPKFFSSIST